MLFDDLKNALYRARNVMSKRFNYNYFDIIKFDINNLEHLIHGFLDKTFGFYFEITYSNGKSFKNNAMSIYFKNKEILFEHCDFMLLGDPSYRMMKFTDINKFCYMLNWSEKNVNFFINQLNVYSIENI